MHATKVTAAIFGVLLLCAGIFQGLSLTGVLGQTMYENPPFLSGVIGGVLPALCGALGAYFVTWAYLPPPKEPE